MVRLDDILDLVQKYNPGADLDLIKKAYVYSAKVHQGQKRRSGEPYLVHPLEVSLILAKMQLDAPSIATGLLHDTIEDTLTTREEISQLFGKKIANLVDGVTKLSKIHFASKEERQAENLRKMFMAMADDIRVILVKLADRLHNMRTLEHLAEEKQIRIAEETLDVYAPIAGRLGIQEIRSELENLSLKYIKPDVWKEIHEKLEGLEKKSASFFRETEEALGLEMQKMKLHVQIFGRVKHIFSVYRKMEEDNLEFGQINDLIAFRVIADAVPDCYQVLGLVHSLWKPIPGRFKDYIGMPKVNNYQSLHTTVIGPKGQRMEFQIRTQKMHEVAEWGIASHWKYKEGGEIDTKDEEKFRWIRRFMEWQKDLSDPAEYLDTLRLDLFTTDVYVFTPAGKLLEFPTGSTTLDFAYAIHTEVGHQCIGARIEGKIVPLRTVLKSGDTVEIITQRTHKPSRDWLKWARTSRARTAIRQFLREEQKQRARELGENLLVSELERYKYTLQRFIKEEKFGKFLEERGIRNEEHLYVLLGYGKLTVRAVLNAILSADYLEEMEAKLQQPESAFSRIMKKAWERSPKGLVQVNGLENVLISIGKCCHPIPGDSIIGFVTRGRGVTVHSIHCSKVLVSDPMRRVDVTWAGTSDSYTKTSVRVICIDKPGLLAEMSEAISREGVNIARAVCRSIGDEKMINTFEVNIRDLKHLHQLIKALQKVKGVINVDRVRDSS